MPDKPKPVTDDPISPAELAKLEHLSSPSVKHLLRWASYMESPQSAQSYLLLAAAEAVKLKAALLASRAEVEELQELNVVLRQHASEDSKLRFRNAREGTALRAEIKRLTIEANGLHEIIRDSSDTYRETKKQLAAAEAFKLKIFKASCSSKPDESWRMILAALEEDDDTRKEATPCKTTSTSS